MQDSSECVLSICSGRKKLLTSEGMKMKMIRLLTILLLLAVTMIFGAEKIVTGLDSATSAASSEQTGPMAGKFSFEGTGSDGKAWTGVLEIFKLNAGRYKGIITASTEGYSGKEKFNGTYIRKTNVFTFTSIVTSGNIQPASYSCKVSRDGKSLSDGIWTGTSDSPGRWTATFTSK